MPFGDKPYGLRDVKITNLAGTTQVDLPAAQTLGYDLILANGMMEGDDRIKSVIAFVKGANWTLAAGGISLAAVALFTGKTATAAGSTPNQTLTLNYEAGDNMPYIKIYGQSMGDGDDDIHVKFFKAKVQAFSGQFQGDTFYVTNCSGIAVDDDTNGVMDIVQNETADDLPTS
jgi:hypothetical protein